MRVPTVSPANDEYFCRELPLFEWWEKSPLGKEGVHLIKGTRPIPSCRGRTKHVRKGEVLFIVHALLSL